MARREEGRPLLLFGRAQLAVVRMRPSARLERCATAWQRGISQRSTVDRPSLSHMLERELEGHFPRRDPFHGGIRRLQARTLGATDYLTKSFNAETPRASMPPSSNVFLGGRRLRGGKESLLSPAVWSGLHSFARYQVEAITLR